ncbi:MAG: hypothetical protein HZA02_09490 [Nitrospinae bacterium]|nr:hypothetical protein [Nitrospinota bacterium]
MKRIVLSLCFSIFILGAVWGQASADRQGAELLLWKKDPYFTGQCGHCAELLSLNEKEDKADFSGYNLDYQSGYYFADLTGPAGTEVALFGGRDFRADRGFLAIVKKDDLPVRIADIEAFPPDAWVEVPGQGKNGAYRVFYRPYSGFKHNVASIGWATPDNLPVRN